MDCQSCLSRNLLQQTNVSAAEKVVIKWFCGRVPSFNAALCVETSPQIFRGYLWEANSSVCHHHGAGKAEGKAVQSLYNSNSSVQLNSNKKWLQIRKH